MWEGVSEVFARAASHHKGVKTTLILGQTHTQKPKTFESEYFVLSYYFCIPVLSSIYFLSDIFYTETLLGGKGIVGCLWVSRIQTDKYAI